MQRFFADLGLTEKETAIFSTLYKLGPQPASTVARHLQMERTTVYKILCKLAQDNLVSLTEKKKTKQFFIPSITVLKHAIQRKKETLTRLEQAYPKIESEFLSLHKHHKDHLPKIRLFDDIDGIKNMYEDMYTTVTEQKYITIKFFASNVFQEQTGANTTLKEAAITFFTKLQKKNISLDSFLGNGILIMEHVARISNIDIATFSRLPAANAAINIFVVGKSLYIIIFKTIPFGIKIENEDLVYSMHFFLENLQTK